MKYIHTILIALLLSSTILAQQTGRKINREKRQEKMESRIESQKIAFITQKLDLTPGEAQLFWPIYNEYQAKTKEMRRQNRKDLSMDNLDENEANEVLDNLLKREQEELDIKKQYLTKLKTVISSKKVARLYIIEKQFRDEMLAKIRNKISQKKRKAGRKDSGF